jgi:DNA (cytosine-5)-methyltransferase 1
MLTTFDPSAAITYLKAARKEWKQAELAKALGISPRQLRRWEQGDCVLPAHTASELQRMLKFGPSTQRIGQFTFVDLFAGVGGIRHAFESIGGECVFTSEWDLFAQKTYLANFPDSRHTIAGDITKIDAEDIPDHDLLLAGFPCQPFSIAGVSKKNALGKAHGFADETQGTLFFDVARIIDAKQPKAFMLENVKNLQSHDGGRTFDVILRTLKQELGYQVFYKVIDGAHFVPQHRERIIIVGFREANFFDWDMLDLPEKGEHVLGEILHLRTHEPRIPHDDGRFFDHENKCVQAKYTLTDNLWTYLQNYKKKHQAAGNGFGFGLVTPSSVTRTLSARYYKDGSEILIDQGMSKNPRRLTPRECARLMGFPDTFKIPVSDTRAYKQFGNSVVVPVIRAVADVMQPFLFDQQTSRNQPAQMLMAA